MEKRKFVHLSFAQHKGLLWTLAIVITICSMIYQRRTGPTYELKGKATFEQLTISYKLLRTEITGNDLEVSLDVPDTSITGHVRFKRYKSYDEWSSIPFKREDNLLQAFLPQQPSAGKLMYFVIIEKGSSSLSLTGEKPVISRYRDDVPAWVFIPHVLFIVIAMLFANRTGFEAFDSKGKAYRYMLWTIGLFFIAAFIFGPLVQKYAFGAYWTGFPFGFDLTDNKALIAMLGWIFAWFMNRKGRDGRGWIFCAAILMLIIYLIPHSLLGSELDYTALPESQ